MLGLLDFEASEGAKSGVPERRRGGTERRSLEWQGMQV